VWDYRKGVKGVNSISVIMTSLTENQVTSPNQIRQEHEGANSQTKQRAGAKAARQEATYNTAKSITSKYQHTTTKKKQRKEQVRRSRRKALSITPFKNQTSTRYCY